MADLSPGFRIDPNEMDSLSRIFGSISGEYRQALPSVIAIPRGGGVGIDRAMATTLKVINEMHSVLYEAIYQHGQKLWTAASNYLAAEANANDAAIQVRRLADRGISVHRAEEVVVFEYLGGNRPSYMPSGPTQTATIYGQREGHTADGKSTLAKIPAETKINPRKPYIQFQHQLIAFDYQGLLRLVDDLNEFIRKADPPVIQLATRVADFCSPYQNYGETVYRFNATFSQDANLASGFHKVTSTISSVIDAFAYAMARKEAWLEEFAHRCHVPDWQLSQLTDGQSKEQIRQRFQEQVGEHDPNHFFGLFAEACVKVLDQAENVRKQAASQLVMLSETITSGGLDYYTKKDMRPGSADPGGLFDDGVSRHPQITKQLENELADDGKRLNDSPDDVRTALGNLSSAGGYGGQIGGVMGGIEDVKKSEDLFNAAKNVGNLAGKIGPVLETLGLLVFVE